jgi:trans-2,3-dihydro-3-hydroxyanthranilate isomerase
METRRVAIVDAFAEEPIAGNAAGVVPDAEGLSDRQMQRIAGELAQSETAFVLPSEECDRRVRYFTPSREVDLCGHATVATHAYLQDGGEIEAGSHAVETTVGTVDVEVAEDGTVWMGTDEESVQGVDLEYDRVAEALGVDPATLRDVGADAPLAVSSTGLPFLVVPANFISAVGDADPDDEAVAELCEDCGAEGVYLFTFDTLDGDATLHGRAFVPLAGIPEDPVTGTASGAAAAYLRAYDVFDGDLPAETTFEQGHFVDRPGTVRVRTADGIQVGGSAIPVFEGQLAVPPAEDDDIIEA